MRDLLQDLIIAFTAVLAIQSISFGVSVISAFWNALSVTDIDAALNLVLLAAPNLAILAALNTLLTAVLGLVLWKAVWWGLGSTSIEPTWLMNILIGICIMIPFVGYLAVFAGAIWGSAFWLFPKKGAPVAREMISEAKA